MATDSVTIKRNIVLRSIVTDKLRRELSQQLQEQAEEIKQRVEQIDQQTRGYLASVQRTDLQQAMTLRKRIEEEKKQYEEAADALLERKAQIQEVSDGTEIVRGTLESFVEISVGDNIAEALSGIEIVTKDDEVVDIRKGELIGEPEESVAEVIQDARRHSGIEVPGET